MLVGGAAQGEALSAVAHPAGVDHELDVTVLERIHGVRSPLPHLEDVRARQARLAEHLGGAAGGPLLGGGPLGFFFPRAGRLGG